MIYKIIELEDMSSAAKRISAKVVVDVDRKQKEDIKKLILDLIEVVRNEKVEKTRTLLRHGNKPFEVVYIYLYKNIDETNHGIPLARASFIDPNCKVKPHHFSNEFIDPYTTIRFDGMYEELGEMIKENKVSDEVFLSNVKKQFEKLLEIYETTRLNINNYDILAEKYTEYEPDLRHMIDNGFVGFPNNEYMKVYRNYQSLLSSLHNIGLFINDKNYNSNQKYHLINMNFETAKENIEFLLANLE